MFVRYAWIDPVGGYCYELPVLVGKSPLRADLRGGELRPFLKGNDRLRSFPGRAAGSGGGAALRSRDAPGRVQRGSGLQGPIGSLAAGALPRAGGRHFSQLLGGGGCDDGA